MVDGMNFQASMHNLTQMDRFQQDSHHTPVTNQEKNAEEAKEEAARRIDMPIQPDQVEGKAIDPENKKEQPNRKRKRKKKKGSKKRPPNRGGDTGRVIDFTA